MGIIYTETYRCDFTNCISSVQSDADMTGWTQFVAPYPAGGMPAETQIRCPSHAGQ